MSARSGRRWGKQSRFSSSRAKCHRPSFRVEHLEDRLLMSANNPVMADVVLAMDQVPALSDTGPGSADSAPVAQPERFASVEEFQSWLVEAAIARWDHLFGQTYQGWGWGRGDYVLYDAAAVFRTADTGLVLAQSFSADFSDTNVQVEGVDEADIVETDGQYLYIISGQDLVIVQAGVGDDLRVASRVRLDFRPTGMYLSGDRLAIVSSTCSSDSSSSTLGTANVLMVDDAAYGWPSSQRETTTVTVLDIADRTAPTLVQRTELDGRLVASRTVDGQLRLVVSNGIGVLPPPIARPVSDVPTHELAGTSLSGITTAPILSPLATTIDVGSAPLIDLGTPTRRTYVYETREEYVARMRDEILDLAVPGVRSVSAAGAWQEFALVDVTELDPAEVRAGYYMTTIATFDLHGDQSGPTATETVAMDGVAEVYATADSIYLFGREAHTSSGSTSIRKYDFSADSIRLAAKGEVQGSLLNQFAADEFDGHLRVVTTSSQWNGGSNVFVLEQVGHRLNVVGSIDGIAPAERLYSVRFMEDRAFLVTFQKVDPLWAIDLSDPANPQVLGELQIPGYSDYLQPIDENHLLAVGRGASGGWFTELQVSIFDVSDMTDPLLVDRYSFDGGRSIATPVTGDRWARGDGDHHAVGYFPSAQIFALPIFSADQWSQSLDGTSEAIFEPGQGGLQVFQIDVDAGFTPLGMVTHDTLIERSVRIDDRLFAISSGSVTVYELTDPAVQLGAVDISPEGGGDPIVLCLPEASVASPETCSALRDAWSATPSHAGANLAVSWTSARGADNPGLSIRHSDDQLLERLAEQLALVSLGRANGQSETFRALGEDHQLSTGDQDNVLAGSVHAGDGVDAAIDCALALPALANPRT